MSSRANKMQKEEVVYEREKVLPSPKVVMLSATPLIDKKVEMDSLVSFLTLMFSMNINEPNTSFAPTHL